jgi:acetolactate synthase-1/2/3 large subunit
MKDNSAITEVVSKATGIAHDGRPVIVDIRIDYSKRTAFTSGTVKTTFSRFPLNEKLRLLTRAAVRHIMG